MKSLATPQGKYIPIEILRLPPRPYNALVLAEKNSLHDVERMSDKELLSLPGIGIISLREIKECIRKYYASEE